MMADLSAYRSWVNNSDLNLFKEKANPFDTWCEESLRFVQWGAWLLGEVARDPSPARLVVAKARLHERYWRRYHSAPVEHRVDAAHAGHPCLHRAYLEICEKLEDLEMFAPVPELESLTEAARISPSEEHPIIEMEAEPEPTAAEVSGIELGVFVNDPEVEEGS
ncbi:hypothetical protein ACI8AC_12680 [Geodermatophilus sp. SYSU D00758]